LYPWVTKENYPNAENQYSRTISIPLYPDMTQEEVDYVIETIKKVGAENHK
jgi:dTDP-4-amino-4,6-dideoxygalactose transaminase